MGKLRQNMKRRWGVFLVVAVFAIGQGGCLWIAAGAAAGGAAGYAYYKGKTCQSFVANFEDAWAATHTALAELGMTIKKEERHLDNGVIKTETSDGDRVRIALDAIPSRIPAEGILTKICVRVGTFGDHSVSERVLYQVSVHLVAGAPTVPTPSTGTPMLGITPIPALQQTGEPPLTGSSIPSTPPATRPLPPPEPIRP